jgi:hypothetical protein
VHRAIGQFPDEPGIDRPKQQLASARAALRVANVLENPSHFATGEISVDDESRFRRDRIRHARPGELSAKAGGTTALPHNGRRNRLAGFAVPHDSRFALIRDSNCSYGARVGARLLQHAARGRDLRGPDVVRVLFYPTGLRKRTGDRRGFHRDSSTVRVVQRRARTRRSFI